MKKLLLLAAPALAIGLLLALATRSAAPAQAEPAAPLHCVWWTQSTVVSHALYGDCWKPIVATPQGTLTYECQDIGSTGCGLTVETTTGRWDVTTNCSSAAYVVIDPTDPAEYIYWCW